MIKRHKALLMASFTRIIPRMAKRRPLLWPVVRAR